MSSAAAAAAASPAPKGKKKLIIIIAAALALAGGAGGGAVVMMKKKAAAAAAAEAADEDGSESDAAAPVEEKHPSADHKTVPTFVPLEPFVVNLADKESDRFAQIGVTLEVDDAKFADDLKAYMPAIRSGILMVLAHKTSEQLLQPEGKLALAREIMRESVLPLGIEVNDGDEEEADANQATTRKKKKKRKAAVHNPVTHVHFSNFIVQ